MTRGPAGHSYRDCAFSAGASIACGHRRVLALLAVLLTVATGARADEFVARDVARLEASVAEIREAAIAEALRLKTEVDQRIASERDLASRAGEQSLEWRILAESAEVAAQANRERADVYLQYASNPQLAPETQESLRQSAESARLSAEADVERARDYHLRAAQRRAEAEERFDAADDLADLAARLQRIIETPVPAAEEPIEAAKDEPAASQEEAAETFKFELGDVIGMWREVGALPLVLVIVQQEPDFEPTLVEGHTDRRVWKGSYTELDPDHPARGQNARVVLNYTPRAEEMNPEIPEWARKAVEGQLRWRLELDEAGTEADPRFSVKWFRGEVRWTEGAERKAWIAGDGVPLTFELEPVYGMQIEALSRPTLAIRLQTELGEHDPDTHPIEALLKGQRFFLRVTLPAEMAEKQGPNLTVTLKALGSDGTDQVELTGTGPIGLRPVVYSHLEAVTIADCGNILVGGELPRTPQRFSLEWTLGWIFEFEGQCLNLDVDNGETVEVQYGDAYQQVTIYKTWVQRGLARHLQGAERLRLIFSSITELPHYDAAQKEAARKRLRMLDNFARIVVSDKFTDLHRFHLGETYLSDGQMSAPGLVLLTDAELESPQRSTWAAGQAAPLPDTDPTWFNPLVKAYLESLSRQDLTPDAFTAATGIAWTSRAEQQRVVRALMETSDRLTSDAVEEMAVNFAFGMYDGFATGTQAGDIILVVWGLDHFNRPVTGWDRVLAAVRLASGATLFLAGPTAAARFAERLDRLVARVARSRFGQAFIRAETLIARAAGRVDEVDGFADLPDMPASLQGAKRQQPMLRLVADPDGLGGPDCGSAARAPSRPRTILRPGGLQDDVLEFADDVDYVKSYWGDAAELDDPFGGRLMPPQTNPDCNVLSVNRAIKEATGRTNIEWQSQKLAEEILVDQAFGPGPANARRPRHEAIELLEQGVGRRFGYPQQVARDYLRFHGFKVAEVRPDLNRRIKLRHIWSLWKKGYYVKAIVELDGTLHAVEVVKVFVNPQTGLIDKVRIFDPAIGRTFTVPAKTLKDKMRAAIDKIERNAEKYFDFDPYGILTIFKLKKS